MKTAGDIVELIGTLITAFGLYYAWDRTSNQWLRRRIDNRMRHFWAGVTRSRRHAEVRTPEAEAMAFASHADVIIEDTEFDETRPVPEQLRAILARLDAAGRDLQSHRRRIQALESEQSQIGPNIAQAVGAEAERTRTVALADLTPALAGVTITAAGILVGLLG